jgi:putative tryptophan/tyrosine transport system substrate-binding protein
VNRREFSGSLATALAFPSLAFGQAAKKIPTLGLLYPNPSSTPQGNAVEIFSARLAELGWMPGKNVILENASAEGHEDRLPSLAATLVQRKVDLIWAAGPEAAVAAARATKTIPIAFYGVGYPVEHGLVDSLARPGRNVTGLASLAGAERNKSIEFLKEVAPKATSLAWIGVQTVVKTMAGGEINIGVDGLNSASRSLGISIRRHQVSTPGDFEVAFAEIARSNAQSMGADFTALTFRERKRIVDFANGRRLPAVFGTKAFVEAGGLLSYGANRNAQMSQSFTYVDRILRGARAAELPVELPVKVELAVNRSTAKMLGLTFPKSILARADVIID